MAREQSVDAIQQLAVVALLLLAGCASISPGPVVPEGEQYTMQVSFRGNCPDGTMVHIYQGNYSDNSTWTPVTAFEAVDGSTHNVSVVSGNEYTFHVERPNGENKTVGFIARAKRMEIVTEVVVDEPDSTRLCP